jgi:hypothetical protein
MDAATMISTQIHAGTSAAGGGAAASVTMGQTQFIQLSDCDEQRIGSTII